MWVEKMDNSSQINWKLFYEKEAEFKRYNPGECWGVPIRVDLIFDLIPGNNLHSVLDVGCGDGYLCHILKSKKGIYNVTGIDISEKRIEMGKNLYKDCTFLAGDAYQIPFDDNSFDLVICSEAIEHLENPLRASKELERVARKYVLITVPNNESLVKQSCPYCLKTFFPDGHLCKYDEVKVRALLPEMKIIEVKNSRKIKLYLGSKKHLFDLPYWISNYWRFRYLSHLLSSRVLTFKEIPGSYLGIIAEKFK